MIAEIYLGHHDKDFVLGEKYNDKINNELYK